MPIEFSTCENQLDFPNRHKTCSVKWDRNALDILPFSVADMDFSASPYLVECLRKGVERSVFGYTDPFPETKRMICEWWNRRYDTAITEESVLFSTGVLHSYTQIIEEFTIFGDKILTFAPIYPPLFNLPTKLGRQVIFSKLKEESWEIDCEDVAMRIQSDPNIRILVLCNPHNPVGKVWKEETLTELLLICFKNDVLVVSDEIHIDLNFKLATSILKLIQNENKVIVLGSPVKTFNVAGIKGSFLFCPSANIRERLIPRLKIRGISDLNLFAYQMLAELYGNSANEDWLKQVKQQILANYRLLCKKMMAALPKVKIAPLEATYLVWIDVREYLTDEQLKVTCQRAKIQLHFGHEFGPNGKGFLRWNIACDPLILAEGLSRFIGEVKNID